MPTPKKLRPNANLVNDSKEVAESFLNGLIYQRVIPKTFSGILTPKFGKYIMIWQFDRNKLIGAAMINSANIPIFTKKLSLAPESHDWGAPIQEEDNGIEPSTL